MKKSLLFFLLLANAYASGQLVGNEPVTEIGELAGVPYRVDIPVNWNHTLLLYYHGYTLAPARYDKTPLQPILAELTRRGYAIAQSGFSEGGWAIATALPETEQLRLYVIRKYGLPKRTYLFGQSIGSTLALASLETFPDRYDGALLLCGLFGSVSSEATEMSALVHAFASYFPGVLPVGTIGAPNAEKPPALDDIIQHLASNPTASLELRTIGKFRNDKELASTLVLYWAVLHDLEIKAGGSVSNTSNYGYTGGPDDEHLNRVVTRSVISAPVAHYLALNYTPTGRLNKPLLALHTLHDPVVPVEWNNNYSDIVGHSGKMANYVEQYLPRDGHCAIRPDETVVALDELNDWIEKQIQPEGGLLKSGSPPK